jgi:hypothetical protein
MIASVDWYEANSETVAARYEEVRTDAVHDWLLDLLPKTQAPFWMSARAAACGLACRRGTKRVPGSHRRMRAAANRLHPESDPLGQRQPADTDRRYPCWVVLDLILLSAVWMHIR